MEQNSQEVRTCIANVSITSLRKSEKNFFCQLAIFTCELLLEIEKSETFSLIVFPGSGHCISSVISGYNLFKQNSCCRKRSLLLYKDEKNDISILDWKLFLQLNERMMQCQKECCIQGPKEEWIFDRIYAFQAKKSTFLWRIQNILQQFEEWFSYHMVLLFIDICFRNLPEYIPYFYKFDDKTCWESKRLIIFCVLSFGYYLLLLIYFMFSLEFWEKLGSQEVTYNKKVTLLQKYFEFEYSIFSQQFNQNFRHIRNIYTYHMVYFL